MRCHRRRHRDDRRLPCCRRGSADILISQGVGDLSPGNGVARAVQPETRCGYGCGNLFHACPADNPSRFTGSSNYSICRTSRASSPDGGRCAQAQPLTPPIKPYLEEKLWFALFWMRPLREFWRRELSERQFLALQKHIPYTWLFDPTRRFRSTLLSRDWRSIAGRNSCISSQKQRDLVLKISGFSELGWGSRSVVIGSDELPARVGVRREECARVVPASTPTSCSAFTRGGLWSSGSSMLPQTALRR